MWYVELPISQQMIREFVIGALTGLGWGCAEIFFADNPVRYLILDDGIISESAVIPPGYERLSLDVIFSLECPRPRGRIIYQMGQLLSNDSGREFMICCLPRKSGRFRVHLVEINSGMIVDGGYGYTSDPKHITPSAVNYASGNQINNLILTRKIDHE